MEDRQVVRKTQQVTWLWVALCIAVVLNVVLVYLLLGAGDYHRAEPPYGCSAAEFLDVMPEPTSIAQTEANGEMYFTILGATPRWDVPDGLPVYVFDASGLLVDWRYDPTEDDEFRRQWILKDSEAISLPEFRMKFESVDSK